MIKTSKILIYLLFALFFICSQHSVLADEKDNPSKSKTHIVKKGDNLFDIAKKNNCTVEELKKWNNLKTNRLDIGQKIIIYTVHTPIDIKTENQNKPTASITEVPPTKKYRTISETPKPKVYTVKSGDCLSKVAEKNNISLTQLKSWNGLRSNKLKLGQKLYVSNPNPPKKVLDEKIEYADNFNFSNLLSDTVKNNPLFVNNSSHHNYMTAEQINKADSIIDYAKSFLGLPYKYRGFGHQFDCSGYTMYVFSKFGIKLPPSSPAQANIGEKVDKKDIRKGDLVFFKGHNSRSKRIGHVGMVIDVDKDSFTMIHSSTSRGIVIERLDHSAFFAKRYVTARRIL